MKYTFVLIATVFLIGITLSDAAKKSTDKTESEKEKEKVAKTGGKEPGKSGGKKDKTIPPDEDEAEDSDKGTDDDDDDDDDDDKDDPLEEEVPAKKPKNSKKAPPKPAKPTSRKQKRKAEIEEDDDSSEEVGKVDPKLLKKLENLQKQLNSVNPESLASALKNTSEDKLSKALPQLKQLSKTLRGTPLGPIMSNLTSLLSGSNPQFLNTLLQVFPNFLSTPITTAGKLGSNLITAVGRTGKSATEFGDTIFNGLGDALEDAQAATGFIPGVDPLIGVARQSLGTAQVVTMDPLDQASGALTQAGKNAAKQLERSRSRRRGLDIGFQ